MLIPIIKADIFLRVEADPTLCLASQKTSLTLVIKIIRDWRNSNEECLSVGNTWEYVPLSVS